MPKARARSATRRPMRPKPTTPNVLPYISVPINLLRFHSPASTEACDCAVCRLMASIRARVCSAVAMLFPCGVFITIMPRRVAASTSTLSIPTPARPITFSLVAAEITSASGLHPLRTISPSYSPMQAINSSLDKPARSTYCTSGIPSSNASPSLPNLSAIKMLYIGF